MSQDYVENSGVILCEQDLINICQQYKCHVDMTNCNFLLYMENKFMRVDKMNAWLNYSKKEQNHIHQYIQKKIDTKPSNYYDDVLAVRKRRNKWHVFDNYIKKKMKQLGDQYYDELYKHYDPEAHLEDEMEKDGAEENERSPEESHEEEEAHAEEEEEEEEEGTQNKSNNPPLLEIEVIELDNESINDDLYLTENENDAIETSISQHTVPTQRPELVESDHIDEMFRNSVEAPINVPYSQPFVHSQSEVSFLNSVYNQSELFRSSVEVAVHVSDEQRQVESNNDKDASNERFLSSESVDENSNTIIERQSQPTNGSDIASIRNSQKTVTFDPNIKYRTFETVVADNRILATDDDDDIMEVMEVIEEGHDNYFNFISGHPVASTQAISS